MMVGVKVPQVEYTSKYLCYIFSKVNHVLVAYDRLRA